MGALNVGRFRAVGAVAAGSRAGPGLQDRTEQAVRHHLGSALRRALARWFDRGDGAVWIIRQVDLSVLVQADATADSLALALAEALGSALGGILSDSEDGSTAIRFESRAAYVRQFILDAASGLAASRWYHAPLSGLAVLPSSAAIRTVLLDDPLVGREALTLLDERELALVTTALDESDEQRLIDGLWDSGSTDSPSSVADDNRELVARARPACDQALRTAGSGARALHALVRVTGIESGAALVQAVRSLLLTARRDPAELILTAPPPPHDQRAMLATHSSRTRSRPRDIPVERSSAERPVSVVLPTRLGGLLFLLTHLNELPCEDRTGCLRWLTAILCAGRAQGRDAVGDAVLRVLLGIPGDFTLRDARSELRRLGRSGQRKVSLPLTAPEYPGTQGWFGLPPEAGIGPGWERTLTRAACTVLQSFARRLPGFADSTPAFLWRNVLGFPATVEFEPDRVIARCQRPPLHLLLTFTGMMRGNEVGRDVSGRSVLVFPES